jgi:hypothetical protein
VAQPAFAPMLDFFAKQSKAATMSAKYYFVPPEAGGIFFSLSG